MEPGDGPDSQWSPPWSARGPPACTTTRDPTVGRAVLICRGPRAGPRPPGQKTEPGGSLEGRGGEGCFILDAVTSMQRHQTFFSCSSATTDKILPTGEQVRYLSTCGLVWLACSEAHVKSYGSFFLQTAGSKLGLFSAAFLSPESLHDQDPGLTHLCNLEHLVAGR